MKKRWIFLMGGILGVIFFFYLYGFSIVRVTNDGWLLNSNDLTQHYLGWTFFRKSDWSFPVGLIDGLRYPHKMSLIYTDSIPLAAIFFKLFAPLLPATFQYFGLYGLLCFFLQGGFAALIIEKYSKNLVVIGAGCFFFISLPVFLYRMFYHTALASQWILLLAILLMFDDCRRKKTYLIWAGMGLLCVGIHFYYIPFVGMLLLFYEFRKYRETKNGKAIVFDFAAFLVAAAAMLYLLGGFYGSFASGGEGLTSFQSNLNTFFNPLGKSTLIKDFDILQGGQNEGMSYLGLGLLALVLAAAVLTIMKLIRGTEKFGVVKLCYGGLLVLSFLLAVGPLVSMGNKELLLIKLPDFVETFWSIFRSTGRFIFVTTYLLLVFVLVQIIRGNKTGCVIAILVAAGILQFVDLSGYFNEIRQNYHTEVTYDNPLDAVEADLGEDNIFYFMPNGLISNRRILYSVAEYAGRHSSKINNFYFARVDKRAGGELKQKKEELLQGKTDSKEVYIFESGYFLSNPELIDTLAENLQICRFEDYYIGFSPNRSLTVGRSCDAKELAEYREKLDYYSEGQSSDGVVSLDQNGVLYGPFINLSEGNYTVRITGDNLSDCDFDVYSSTTDTLYETEPVFHDNHTIEYSLPMTENGRDIETRVTNSLDTKVQIASITITRN